MIANKLKTMKASKRFNLAIRTLSFTLAGCFLVGSAFALGSAAVKPSVIHFDNAKTKVTEAYYNSGVETGANEAANYIRADRASQPFDLRSLEGSAAAAFVKGYVAGYYDQQENAAKAGMIYGVCLQMNHIERVDAFNDEHKQTVALPITDFSEKKIVLGEGFAKGVRQSYEISNWTYSDIRLGIDRKSQSCDLDKTAEKVEAWATELNSTFLKKGSELQDLDKFVEDHFPEEANAAVTSSAYGAAPHNNWQMSYIDGDQPLL